MMEYEIGRFTRRCAASERELRPGETFYSTLIDEEGEIRRLDFSAAAWKGPPEGTVGWWKSRLPEDENRAPPPTPQEALEQYFDHLELDPHKQDVRYILALLMVRRRLWRLESIENDAQGREILVLFSQQSDAPRRALVVDPPDERIQQIQEELDRLLFSNGRS
jgi:hypothetical protein